MKEQLPIFRSSSGSPLRVLLAEDNIMNQKVARIWLERLGLSVDIAGHGEAVLEKLRENTFDLILMDIQMPVMDGYETTRRIRQELCLDLPVIAMTAHTSDKERENSLLCGMNGYLSKPFRDDELYHILHKYLQPELPGALPETAPPCAPDTSGLVDFSILNDLGQGDPRFITELISLFLKNNPGDIAALERSVEQKDMPGIQAISHRMKTSVGFVGLKITLEKLSVIEALAGKKTEPDTIAGLLQQVKSDCIAAGEELRQFLNTPYA
jgi:CheY-like chemotaxis protein